MLLLKEPIIRDTAKHLTLSLVHQCERADLFGRVARQNAGLAPRYWVRARFARGMIDRMFARLCRLLAIKDDPTRMTMITKLYLKGSTLPDWARQKEG